MDIGVILGVFIIWPAFALVPAAIFIFMFVKCRRPVIFFTALAWLAYFPYEQAMKLRILCSGECNIRIDLLLFYPLLAFLSAFAIYSYIKTNNARNHT